MVVEEGGSEVAVGAVVLVEGGVVDLVDVADMEEVAAVDSEVDVVEGLTDLGECVCVRV